MIRMKQQSLALHSCDVPGYEYKMWQYWKMPKNATAMDVVFWINWAIDHSDEQYLHNVIINCHGTQGFLHVGGAWVGFGVEGTSLFKSVKRGGVGTIWLVACEVAQNKATNIGTMFCSELAKAAGCDVVAADALQHVDVTFYLRICPFGAIDDYEGNVSRFSPSGTSAPYDPAAG